MDKLQAPGLGGVMMTNRVPSWAAWSVIALCFMAAVWCGVRGWRLPAAEVAAPVAEMKRTDAAVGGLKADAKVEQGRIEARAEVTKERIKYIRRDTKQQVAALSPDAVAFGVAAELRIFESECGNNIQVCPGGVSDD